MWQSRNEGYTWTQLFPGERFLGFYPHKYASGRAYLITDSKKFYFTSSNGLKWEECNAPSAPNRIGVQVIRFHPRWDRLLWVGMEDCVGNQANCRVRVHYSMDNGRRWTHVEDYVRNCAWVQDLRIDADPNEILCESYRDKMGNQLLFGDENPLQLVTGIEYYARKKTLFNDVTGFANISQYLVVAEVRLVCVHACC
jgi:hypothetical protein